LLREKSTTNFKASYITAINLERNLKAVVKLMELSRQINTKEEKIQPSTGTKKSDLDKIIEKFTNMF
jgi:hypothetical protein